MRGRVRRPERQHAYNAAMFGVRAAVISAMLMVAGVLAVAERRGSTAPLIVTRHFTPADRVSGRYQYVPIEVPSARTNRVSLVRP